MKFFCQVFSPVPCPHFLPVPAKYLDGKEEGARHRVCKTGLNKEIREEFYERIQNVNRYVIGAIIQTEGFVNSIIRELKKISPGLKIDNTEIDKLLQNDVLKRGVLEGDSAKQAKLKVKKFTKKKAKKIKPSKPVSSELVNPIKVISEKEGVED